MKLPIAPIVACLTIGIAAAPLAQAQWLASVGAQKQDKGTQALAFLPNEIWIHAGDSITWKLNADEPHTVTFLITDQVRPPFPVGCPGVTPSPAGFDGTQCVNSGPLGNGQSYTVVFPTSGNYKLVCLFHESMNATVHVLDPSLPLPHDQAYYNRVAAAKTRDLFLQGQIDSVLGRIDAQGMTGHPVVAGVGSIAATAGGSQTVSIVRFMQPQVTVHAGDTVEWNNADPVTPHTITFGAEPMGDPGPPSANVTVDADGVRHATINSQTDSVHSGFIVASGQERIGVPQADLGATRFRATFTQPGLYPYICALHDGLGMKGTVVVVP
ncbi:MAG: plastocyanin/azurin family copper-binding protein [Rhodanobacteraceae bacterium]